MDTPNDKDYEQLNDAILKAILSSGEVKNILVDFKKKDLINNMAVLNLILSLEELSELIFSKSTAGSIYKMEPLENNFKTTNQCEMDAPHIEEKFVIDGKGLSDNEILFEEFCQRQFDERGWLKKTKIKF